MIKYLEAFMLKLSSGVNYITNVANNIGRKQGYQCVIYEVNSLRKADNITTKSILK